jgi:hypothetical protein
VMAGDVTSLGYLIGNGWRRKDCYRIRNSSSPVLGGENLYLADCFP